VGGKKTGPKKGALGKGWNQAKGPGKRKGKSNGNSKDEKKERGPSH